MKRYLLLLSVLLSTSAIAASDKLAKDEILIHGERKNIIGTIKQLEQGDIACYVDLIDNQGQPFHEMASFEVCDETGLINKKVRIHYEQANVLAASCMGNMDCGKSDSVVLIGYVEAVNYNDETVISHCLPTEQIIFSCTSRKKKTMSLCASAKLSADSGYLQYRYGAVKKEPELTYPKERIHPMRTFLSGRMIYAGGGGAYLRFNKGAFIYTIYTGIGKGWEKEGVLVHRADRQLADIPCDGAWISELGPVLFEQIGIPDDPKGFEIP